MHLANTRILRTGCSRSCQGARGRNSTDGLYVHHVASSVYLYPVDDLCAHLSALSDYLYPVDDLYVHLSARSVYLHPVDDLYVPLSAASVYLYPVYVLAVPRSTLNSSTLFFGLPHQAGFRPQGLYVEVDAVDAEDGFPKEVVGAQSGAFPAAAVRAHLSVGAAVLAVVAAEAAVVMLLGCLASR
eukprot:4731664-Amphidinium_carterae.1